MTQLDADCRRCGYPVARGKDARGGTLRTEIGYPEPDRGPLQVLRSHMPEPEPLPEPEPEPEAEP